MLVSNEQLVALFSAGRWDDAEVSMQHTDVGHCLCEALGGLADNFVSELGKLYFVAILIAKYSVFDASGVLSTVDVARRLDLH